MNPIESHSVKTGDAIRFFGKITAVATHEMKNILSIINENAGLMEDLLLMTENGHPFQFDKARTISSRLQKQVQRSDDLLKNLNRFSHSADGAAGIIDLAETVSFILKMGNRLIEKTRSNISVVPPDTPVMVSSHVFYLQQLLWRAIEQTGCLDHQKMRLTLSYQTDGVETTLWFSPRPFEKIQLEQLFDSQTDQMLLTCLNIQFKKRIDTLDFGLYWPGST
mgnify:CR=1 FL=1